MPTPRKCPDHVHTGLVVLVDSQLKDRGFVVGIIISIWRRYGRKHKPVSRSIPLENVTKVRLAIMEPPTEAELGGEKLEEGIMRSDAKSLLVNCPAEQLAFILPNKRMSKKGAKQFMCKLLGCNAISKGFCFWVPMGYLRSVAAVVRCRG